MTFPIRELSPYHRNWTICARVTSEPKIREFTAQGGRGGKVFSVDLLDKEGDQIRASFFNDAVTKFASLMEKGKVFTFSKGNIKVADKRFNNLSHPYEITFFSDAMISPAADDVSIQMVKYSFVPLKVLATRALPFTCDVLGVVIGFQAPRQFNSKATNQPLTKAGITVCDETGHSIEVGIWGDQASTLKESDFAGNPVMALKGVRIQEFQGRTGSLSESGTYMVYDGLEAHALKRWWDSEGSSMNACGGITKLTDGMANAGPRNTKLLTLSETRDKTEEVGHEPEYWDAIARLSFVATKNRDGEAVPVMYHGCQEQVERNGRMIACNKKMDRNTCTIHGPSDKSAWRWMPRAQFQDATDTLWLPCFENEFTQIVGKTADMVHALQEKGTKIEKLLRQSYFGGLFRFRLQAKLEEYQGENRPKVRIVAAKPISFAERGRQCLDQIRQLVGDM